MKKAIIKIAMVTAVMLFGTSQVQAALVFFDTADPLVLPGETISVSIFSTVETDSIRMDRISDADFGIASNLYLNPDYIYGLYFDKGIAINSGGVLIEGVRGGVGTTISPTVSGVLYSFDYLVPMASPGHTITIFSDPSGGAINEVDVIGMVENVTPESLTLTVVPEPATILLLGLGGFWLARKNR